MVSREDCCAKDCFGPQGGKTLFLTFHILVARILSLLKIAYTCVVSSAGFWFLFFLDNFRYWKCS